MIDALRHWTGKQLRRSRRSRVRLQKCDLFSAFCQFGELRASILMVHSSLSACGTIQGGADTVIATLQEWIDRRRTLVMPTHTYCYPDSDGTVPVYDATSTHSLVGQITEHFWPKPGVSRSIHPTHSLAAAGPSAMEICAGHEYCETPCGKGTPYERLIHGECAVLMFGVTLNTYTFFHTAEDAAELPYLYEREPYFLKYRDASDAIREMKMWRHNMKITRAFRPMDTWLESRGLLKRARLGLGELLFIPNALHAHNAVMEELKVNPLLLVDESVRPSLAKYLQPI
jgi:aminoglycoside 3-N-acetyltransferase